MKLIDPRLTKRKLEWTLHGVLWAWRNLHSYFPGEGHTNPGWDNIQSAWEPKELLFSQWNYCIQDKHWERRREWEAATKGWLRKRRSLHVDFSHALLPYKEGCWSLDGRLLLSMNCQVSPISLSNMWASAFILSGACFHHCRNKKMPIFLSALSFLNRCLLCSLEEKTSF